MLKKFYTCILDYRF